MLLQLTVFMSVRNRCVIEIFGGVFVLSRSFLEFYVGVGSFVVGQLQSQTSSFLDYIDECIEKNVLRIIIFK